MNLLELFRAFLSRLTQPQKPAQGFTLIEILVVIGMLAILSTVVLVAVNPLRQFAQARNSQRQSNVAAVLNAVSERIADNGGIWVSSTTALTDNCTSTLPDSARVITKSQLDLRKCLVPSYLPELPFDPATGSNSCKSTGCSGTNEDYDLEYTIQADPTTHRVTVCSPNSAEASLPGSTQFCLSR